MITIDGVTEKQASMLDKLWSFDTMDEVLEWMDTLNTEDQQMVDVLMEMIRLEATDLETAEMNSFPEVEKILKNL
jgi:hypothetical protein